MSKTAANLQDVFQKIPDTEGIEKEIFRLTRMLGLLIETKHGTLIDQDIVAEIRKILIS